MGKIEPASQDQYSPHIAGVCSIRGLWSSLLGWVKISVSVPPRLPAPLRHPFMGYLLAWLITLGAVSLDMALMRTFPSFGLSSLLTLLAVVLIAVTWGPGPSLAATLLGTALLNALILPGIGRAATDPDHLLDNLIVLIVGLTLTSFTSWGMVQRRSAERSMGVAAQARQEAEELAASLAQEQVRTDLERKRLEVVFDAMTDAVLVFDSSERIFQRNAADRRLFAFDAEPETLDERRMSIRLRDEYGQPLSQDRLVTIRALEGGLVKCPASDIMARTSRGEETLLKLTAAPLRDAEGQIAGGVMVLRDVTERRQLEREVERRAHELEVVFESITDGVFVYDLEGHIVRVNTAGRRLFNLDTHPEYCALSAAERIPHYHVCYEHDAELPPERWPLARLLRGEVLGDPNAVDVSYRALDGRSVEGSMSGAPLRNANGHIIGAVMVLRDLTERQRLERRTYESLQALLAMAEALVQSPEIPASPEQGITGETSLAAHRLTALVSNLLGCSSVSIAVLDVEQGISQPLTELSLPPDEERRWWAGERWNACWLDGTHREVLARLQVGETVVLDRTSPLLRDELNSYHAQSLLAIPMRVCERLVGLLILNPRGEPSRYAPQEIALAEAAAKLGALVLERERLLRERELAQANALALRQANQQMDTFLGMATHELKTPLTSILLGQQMLQRRMHLLQHSLSGVTEDAVRQVEAVHALVNTTFQQAGRLNRLVNELLDTSSIQAGRLVLRVRSADLVAIVRAAVEEQRQAAPERQIHLSVLSGCALSVLADAERIGQVVTNYLTNALKYSCEDCPVTVGLDLERQHVRVWVRDRGPGIPPDEQERLWERFHRVPGIEIQCGSGIGLGIGLHISKTIMEQHGGQVGVQSTPGQGSTFWFTLPLATPEQGQQGQAAEDLAAPTSPLWTG